MTRRAPLARLFSLMLFSTLACTAERPAASRATPKSGFEIVQSWPHDPRAFTQGLVYREGKLYEGTGLYSESNLREVDLQTGNVLRRRNLDPKYIGEGLALLGGKLYQLTWRSQLGFIYDATTFELVGQFSYSGEGWGLTEDGSSLILSDGTSTLRFLDPSTFAVRRSVKVTDEGREIPRLNELEYVNGEVYANVWQSDLIARIDPSTGHVKGWIDLSGLLPEAERTENTDVLNGIAYDAAQDRLLVTGKRWPKLFQIRLVPR
jgi:glutamine cyclotransferase